MPILLEGLEMVRPSMSLSMTKAVMPLVPSSGLVITKMMKKSAYSALVMKILLPLTV